MIYLDSQASTPVHPAVLETLNQAMLEHYANPHSQHSPGQSAMHQIDLARKEIADYLGVDFAEIIFTSGATESNNLAIQGVIRTALDQQRKLEIITTPIEHSSVLEVLSQLQQEFPERISLKYLPIDKSGIVKATDVQNLLSPETVLVSVMQANNEIGTIQPIAEIGKAVRKYKQDRLYPLFHSDGVQAIWFNPINMGYANLDLYSLSGHKIYAPKGIGILYVKKNSPIKAITWGGGQEYKMRPGTLNPPLIAALKKAFQLMKRPEHAQTIAKISTLRDKLLDQLLAMDGVSLNGDRQVRLPQNINIAIQGKLAQDLVIQLDLLAKIAVSAGSACHSGVSQASSVIQAIYPDTERAKSSLRLSLSQFSTEQEIETFLKTFKKLI